MKCKKCKSELSFESKFCSNCGGRVEEESITSIFDKGIDMTRKTWFLFGFLRGISTKGKKKSKWFENFENEIKTKMPEIWEEYQSTINYWKEQIKNNDNG